MFEMITLLIIILMVIIYLFIISKKDNIVFYGKSLSSNNIYTLVSDPKNRKNIEKPFKIDTTTMCAKP